MEVKLERDVFQRRVEYIYKYWNKSGLNNADAWLITLGKSSEDVLYQKVYMCIYVYIYM